VLAVAIVQVDLEGEPPLLHIVARARRVVKHQGADLGGMGQSIFIIRSSSSSVISSSIIIVIVVVVIRVIIFIVVLTMITIFITDLTHHPVGHLHFEGRLVAGLS
jgi:hypothetical protein